CWPFSDRSSAISTTDAKVLANSIIFIQYPNGETAGAPIVNILPCQQGYSDAWVKLAATVNYTTPQDYYRDVGKVKADALSLKRVGLFNYPIVPPGSILNDWSNHSIPAVATKQAWYNAQQVFFFDFGEIPQDPALDSVGTKSSVSVFTSDAHGIPVLNGFSIVDSIAGQPGYTGFYA
ncbi:hypothetical protein HK101_005829, partial [Irineochytrium annulatum]